MNIDDPYDDPDLEIEMADWPSEDDLIALESMRAASFHEGAERFADEPSDSDPFWADDRSDRPGRVPRGRV